MHAFVVVSTSGGDGSGPGVLDRAVRAGGQPGGAPGHPPLPPPLTHHHTAHPARLGRPHRARNIRLGWLCLHYLLPQVFDRNFLKLFGTQLARGLGFAI